MTDISRILTGMLTKGQKIFLLNEGGNCAGDYVYKKEEELWNLLESREG
jgi:hypothetical protein